MKKSISALIVVIALLAVTVPGGWYLLNSPHTPPPAPSRFLSD